ncbi:MAG: MarR family winged helix-turn-helix transcriptional regulator [Gemmatimonadales bacterium]
MPSSIGQQLKQRRAFVSPDQEAMLGIRMVAARMLAPWERFLKAEADLTASQYNVLRILRGSHPKPLTAGEVGERTIARDPDITRLVDRLDARGLVKRARSEEDRRVVEVEITAKGLELLRALDPHARRMPRALIGHVGPRKLRLLSRLLAEVLDGMGTYP